MSPKQDQIKVQSLPIREVISDLAKCLNAKFKGDCEVYSLKIPATHGEGQIRGVQYNSGLGLIFYNVRFNRDIEIHFTKSEIHPAKFIYSQEGELIHRFADDTDEHVLPAYRSILVASGGVNGHVLRFKANTSYRLSSLEIDRKRFLREISCSIERVSSPLRLLLEDVEASNRFYHEGQYSLEFDQILDQIDNFPHRGLSRLLYLQAKAAEMLTLQVLDYDDDLKEGSNQSRLRHSEVSKIRDAMEYIRLNLAKNFTVSDLAREVGTNEHKLQDGFRVINKHTVMEYVRIARLDKARQLLLLTDLTVSEIVFKVGWENRGHFSKIFKEHFGHLPTDFRKLNSY